MPIIYKLQRVQGFYIHYCKSMYKLMKRLEFFRKIRSPYELRFETFYIFTVKRDDLYKDCEHIFPITYYRLKKILTEHTKFEARINNDTYTIEKETVEG